MLVAIRDNVARLKKQGKYARRNRRGQADRGFRRKWGQFVIDPGFFTRLVYEGV